MYAVPANFKTACMVCYRTICASIHTSTPSAPICTDYYTVSCTYRFGSHVNTYLTKDVDYTCPETDIHIYVSYIYSRIYLGLD